MTSRISPQRIFRRASATPLTGEAGGLKDAVGESHVWGVMSPGAESFRHAETPPQSGRDGSALSVAHHTTQPTG